MTLCARCGLPIGETERACAACGASRPSTDSTLEWRETSTTPGGREDGAGLAPGMLFAKRYRIIALAGQGAMGDVYRATDLKLGQPVALKFLPDALAKEPGLLERFLLEVSLTRQISHPNVCRVHDVGEVGGRHFLTMEYVDGEDLASLLRRVGRFPHERALLLSHQLCAGLAAAHGKEIVHRDLKPSNVLVDGRGQARIADFGLAVTVSFASSAELAGTPAYMAPEQFDGAVSVRSDVYALGLVMYELFVGRRAFEGRGLAELRRRHREEPPAAPSSVVPGVDPAVERTILRCLEKDPRDRFASVAEVAAALPGGDTLLGLVSAGGTPSPEMLAAAGPAGGLRVGAALGLAVPALATLALVTFLSGRASLLAFVPLETPPDALSDRAARLLETIGSAPAADQVHGFLVDHAAIAGVSEGASGASRWASMREGWPAVRFFHRQSPASLDPRPLLADVAAIGVIPRLLARIPAAAPAAGSALVELDTRGRLLRLEALPRREWLEGAPAPESWPLLFEAAGLDMRTFTGVPPLSTERTAGDTHLAWRGPYPRWPGGVIRVEAASFRGRPVGFELVAPPGLASDIPPGGQSQRERTSHALYAGVFLLVVLGGIPAARRNLRLGHGDRRSAFRLAAAFFALSLLTWALGAHHAMSLEELAFLLSALSWSLLGAGCVWVLYVALEPYARRRWPAALVSWSRALRGRFTDPLVGRHVLIGVLLGSLGLLRLEVPFLLASGAKGALPVAYFATGPLLGLRQSLAVLCSVLMVALADVLGYLFLLLVLRLALRNDWLAAVAFALAFGGIDALRGVSLLTSAPLALATWAVLAILLMRVGLVAGLVARAVGLVLVYMPITSDVTAWYGTATLLVLVSVTVLSVLAAAAATRGVPTSAAS